MKNIVICLLLVSSVFFGQSKKPVVGIWYSTWHANHGNYLWVSGHGFGSANQLISDVNGDGKGDAVVFFNSGDWYVALSNGDGFNTYTKWGSGHGVGSANQLISDVNGDGKGDAVVFFNSGDWYVALSNGNGFNKYIKWSSGFGLDSANQLLGDVNGDGKGDAVVFFNSGDWYVALSNGTRFNKYIKWSFGHGLGSANQLLGDVNGDGKGDAVVFFNSGDWYVALSNGTRFNNYTKWVSGHGLGSANQLLGDVNGDGKADAMVYFKNGNWYKALSSGDKFQNYEIWRFSHSYDPLVKEDNPSRLSMKQFLVDINGDKIADPTTFHLNGKWYSITNPDNLFNKTHIYNTWQGWGMQYQPIIKGELKQYDDSNRDVTDFNLQMIAEAKIDFLIFDETNNLYVDNHYIIRRAEAIISRIKEWNKLNTHKIKYAFAVGGAQYNNKVETLQGEADIVYNVYYSKDKENYYVSETGKPLIVSYNGYYNHDEWIKDGSLEGIKNKFDLQFAQDSNRPGLYGWQVRKVGGPWKDKEVMTIMPGWRNRLDSPNDVPRDSGDYYIKSWESVLEVCPKTVIINSFNEYAERTAIAPTDTSNLERENEKWRNVKGEIDNNFYWNHTVKQVTKLKDSCNLEQKTSVQINKPVSLQAASDQIIKQVSFVNPVNNILTFSQKVKSIKIYNNSGQLVKKIDNASNNINISDLKKGIYIINYQTEFGETSSKLIKE